ncbi:MAG TPA: hypothetical protein VGA73_12625 [Candidatus Binatia bacterium]
MMDRSEAVLDDRLPFLFQPDVLIPDQYFATLRARTGLEPEKRLMLAVLEDAVYRFQKNVAAESEAGKEVFAEAEAWLLEPGGDWVFSFESICDALGLDPAYVRRGLGDWKEKHGRFPAKLSLVPLLIAEPDIAPAARAALAEKRFQDAAGLLMQQYGLDCVEAGQLLDVAAC